MNKDMKNFEKDNESINLFIDKLALIITEMVLEESKGKDNQNYIQTA